MTRRWIRTAARRRGVACAVRGARRWPQAPSSNEDEQVKARQRISTMEGVLERAVSNGAENLLRQVRTVMPDAADAERRAEGARVPAGRLRRVLRRRGAGAAAAGHVAAAVPHRGQPAPRWPPRSPSCARWSPISLPRERDRFELLARRLESRAVTPRATPRQADPVVTEPDVAYTEGRARVAHRRDDREQRAHRRSAPTSG